MARKGLLSPKGEGKFASFADMNRKLTKLAARYLLDISTVASEITIGFNKRRCTDLSSLSPEEVIDKTVFVDFNDLRFRVFSFI